MARSHLTLAALAASAVPDLDAVAVSSFGTGTVGDFDAAVITGRDGRHWIIRVPRSPRAEAEQSADLVALRALSQGVRTRLPFAVSSPVGQAPVDGTRAVVYEFVYGSPVPLGSWDAGLASSAGAALGAVHALPSSVVGDAGLPVQSAADCQRSCLSVADRAAATGVLPAMLVGRWERAIEDGRLWQFQPTVVNGSITSGSFLTSQGAVSGLIGWHGLKVGDPASDLQFALGAHSPEVVESVFAGYESVRGVGDRQLLQRARLYSELELAKWLLHGTETRSTEIVDDAVELLTALVDRIHAEAVGGGLGADTPRTLEVDEVEELLGRTRRAV
jgi:aminoglycoside phosphotransferase (APT) family kinase protein